MWIDPESDGDLLSDLWPDAPDGAALTLVLESAQEQCEAFAPALAEGADVPARYRLALILQARAAYRSLIAGSGDLIGPDGLTVTVWPMDRTVKGLLRPPALRRVL